LIFAGDKLVLNVAAAGLVRVAVTSEAGEALTGFDLADCDPIVPDSVREVVSWNGSSDVSGLAGKVVRLEFEMQDAKLYAFQFTWSGDFNNDGAVDYSDVGILSDDWLWSGEPGAVPADIDEDGSVNFDDFAMCALRWVENSR
jgi:hypothetical protein